MLQIHKLKMLKKLRFRSNFIKGLVASIGAYVMQPRRSLTQIQMTDLLHYAPDNGYVELEIIDTSLGITYSLRELM